MAKIRLGMFGGASGTPFAEAHRRASRICNKYDLLGGVFSSDFENGKIFADKEGLDISRCYPKVDDFIKGELKLAEDKRIEAVSIVTPNCFHYEMAKKALQNGFHVICEKPMTMTIEEAQELKEIVDSTGLTFALMHTYTGYPMVRQMRQMIRNGEIGEIQRIDAQYYQGWMNPIVHGGNIDEVWRLNPEVSGVSSCMGDIGVHAFNLIEYTTGLEIREVLADLNKVVDNVDLDLDGTVLLRFNAKTKGVIRSSQVATGEENNLSLAVYGSKFGLRWGQENPNQLFLLSDDQPARKFKPGNPYINKYAAKGHNLPHGHPEGFYEAIANIYDGVAKSIKGEKGVPGDYPTVLEGVRGMKFIHRVVGSNDKGNIWVSL